MPLASVLKTTWSMVSLTKSCTSDTEMLIDGTVSCTDDNILKILGGDALQHNVRHWAITRVLTKSTFAVSPQQFLSIVNPFDATES
jgi:hypothetical protein